MVPDHQEYHCDYVRSSVLEAMRLDDIVVGLARCFLDAGIDDDLRARAAVLELARQRKVQIINLAKAVELGWTGASRDIILAARHVMSTKDSGNHDISSDYVKQVIDHCCAWLGVTPGRHVVTIEVVRPEPPKPAKPKARPRAKPVKLPPPDRFTQTEEDSDKTWVFPHGRNHPTLAS